MKDEMILRDIEINLFNTCKQYGFFCHIMDIRKIMGLVSNNGRLISEILSPREMEIYNNYTLPKKRLEWLAGRWTAKIALSHYKKWNNADTFYKEIDVLRGKNCEPYFLQYGNIALSISHCYPYCIAVVGEQDLGIDIEKVFMPEEALINFFYNSNEASALKTAKDTSKTATIYWTRKEAVSKFLKLGMKLDFQKIDTVNDIVRLSEYEANKVKTVSFCNMWFCVSLAFKEEK